MKIATSLAALMLLGSAACGAPPRPTETGPAEPRRPAASAAPRAAPPADGGGTGGAPALPYPATRSEAVFDVLHGVRVADPYRWLEDEKSPEVQAWMKAEDALTRAELEKLPERDAIARRLEQLYYIDSISAPRRRAGRSFYTRRHADKEKAVVYWKGGAGDEHVLLDPNAWSKEKNLSLGGWQVDWNGNKVAYRVKQNNSDEATLHVLDVKTGKASAVDVIEGAKYASASWTPRGDGFYYTWLPTDPSIPTAERPGYAEVRFHRLGDDPKNDRLVHERTGDASSFIDANLSRDGRWLILTVHHGWTSADVYFRAVEAGGPPAETAARPAPGQAPGPRPQRGWSTLTAGTKAHYEVEAHNDRFYVHTDEGASRQRVFEVDPRKPERAAWKEIVPEHPEATLGRAVVLGGRLALSYLEKASSRLEIRELDGRLVREVPLPGIGTVSGPIGLPDADDAYYHYQSFTVPEEVHATSIKTGKTTLHARPKVPVDPTPFTVTQVHYPSKDGTRISMFLVHRKDLVKDGSARALLYGYGGFQATETPRFAASIYPWLERGGIYAVANLRGGAEYGEAWHTSGMLLQKQNVFDDFIGAAEFLIREKLTRPDRLVIQGASNGGLLVGAAIVQRPELFAAGLCGVPLLDMIRYHRFGSGKTWVSEYGSAEDQAQFAALHAYSPYHHVEPGARYPALLLLSADSDDRVDPMHARKFAAALQASSRGGPVLLRIERDAGHGGADMIKAAVQKGADQSAFALAHTAAAGRR